MLLLSFSLLLAAALLGTVLAALHLKSTREVSLPWPVRALHGTLGVAGFVTLLLSLGGPPRGEAMGVASFGRFAAVLLGLALLLGVSILRHLRRYRRLPILIGGVHATIAIGGIVILAAYTLIG